MSNQPPPGGGRLPDDVYKKIRAVDQGTSTLTQAGIQGLSARILDKQEYQSPQSSEKYIVQLVEIIKKPGQSLGLYLREGNGFDRAEGVFASRFGDNSELERYGEIIQPGDEILSINNVDVAKMGIDDVVLILSIPRRLLLRIRFVKNRRPPPPSRSSLSERPVVVFHKVEERRESEPGSILSQPTNTASTWLGKKARQQQEMSRTVLPPTCSMTPRTSSSYQPRLLNGEAEPLDARFVDSEPNDSVSRTARVPPPKIGTVRRTDSFNSAPGASVGVSSMYTLPRSSTTVPPTEGMLSRSLCSPTMSRRVDSKSNSLPRRRAVSGPRNVKWRNDVLASDIYDDDGTTSAPEYSSSPAFGRPYSTPRFSGGRTVNDIFSAAEYRHWATPGDPRFPRYSRYSTQEQPTATRWSYGDPRSARSSSVPRTLVAQSLVGSPVLPRHAPPPMVDRPAAVYDRYHVSPLMNRRAPLRPAGPGINVDRLQVDSLTGILFVQIYEGRNLHVPEKDRERTEEMYCVLEVNDQHRARTSVAKDPHREERYRWKETFHIDVFEATFLQIYIYSWHPQYRHKLWFRGSLRLLDKFIIDQLTGDKMFSLNLEPRGRVNVRVGFHDMLSVFRRCPTPRSDAGFGVPLLRLYHRERRETPIVLTRLLQELEKRGLDSSGLYTLCGAVEKKHLLRDDLERNPLGTDLSYDAMPDTNVLACLIKDFLRELPEPLIPLKIHATLLDAQAVALPNDVQANRQLIFRVVDCLATHNRLCLMMVLDHLVGLLASAPHNGLSLPRLSIIFGPLLLCSSESPPDSSSVRSLDVAQSATTLQYMLEHWPSRVNGSESGSDSSSSAQITGSESQC